jgi:hypothetical protein
MLESDPQSTARRPLAAPDPALFCHPPPKSLLPQPEAEGR